MQKKDLTSALRQQRRREKVKSQGGRKVQVTLTKEQCEKLERLVESGYEATQSGVLSKALDEVFEASRRRGL